VLCSSKAATHSATAPLILHEPASSPTSVAREADCSRAMVLGNGCTVRCFNIPAKPARCSPRQPAAVSTSNGQVRDLAIISR